MTPRSTIAFAFALILALTSQMMAVTRVGTDAAGQVVLCIGAKAVVVYVDDEGQPTAAPHICPDCALTDGFLPETPSWAAPVAVARAIYRGLPRDPAPHAAPLQSPPPRGPPAVV